MVPAYRGGGAPGPSHGATGPMGPMGGRVKYATRYRQGYRAMGGHMEGTQRHVAVKPWLLGDRGNRWVSLRIPWLVQGTWQPDGWLPGGGEGLVLQFCKHMPNGRYTNMGRRGKRPEGMGVVRVEG